MEKNTIKLYKGKAYGVNVSGYGLKNGYLDYKTLSRIIGDCILNNTIWSVGYPEDWDLVSGEDCYGLDVNGNECEPFSDECVDIIPYDIYQHYIIPKAGYKFLRQYTDEIVYYNNELDLYLWGVTHFGISWDYVLTNVKLGSDEQ